MKLNKNKKIKYFLRIYVIELRIANYELNSGRPLEILRSLGSINNRQTNAVEQLKMGGIHTVDTAMLVQQLAITSLVFW